MLLRRGQGQRYDVRENCQGVSVVLSSRGVVLIIVMSRFRFDCNGRKLSPGIQGFDWRFGPASRKWLPAH